MAERAVVRLGQAVSIDLQGREPAQMVRVLGSEGCRSKVPRDALNNARMATFDRLHNTPEAKWWVQAIFDETLAYEGGHAPRKRQRKRNDQISFFQACGAFAHDLIRADDNYDALGVCFRASHSVALSDTLISGTNFEFLIGHWSNIGWLENTQFFQAKEPWEGSELDSGYSRCRWYRATNDFIDLAAQHQITPENIAGHFALDLENADLIQIRQESKRSGGQKVKPKPLTTDIRFPLEAGQRTQILVPKRNRQMTALGPFYQMLHSALMSAFGGKRSTWGMNVGY